MPIENEHLGVPLAHGLGHIFRTLEELTAARVARADQLTYSAARVRARARAEAIHESMTGS